MSISTSGPRLRRTGAAAAAVLALAGLAACSTDSTTPAASATTSTTDDAPAAFPTTIDHAFGATTIEAQPTRVAAISWANQDSAIALGVVPVAMPFASYGGDENGYLPWTLAGLEALGEERPELFSDTDGIPFEDVAGLTPEVILGTYSGITQEDYDQLTKIAPTVAYPEDAWGADWKDQLTYTGQALGKTAEAEALRADIEQQLADVVAGAPEIQGKTFAYLSFSSADPSSVFYYTVEDSRVEFVESLGLESSPKIVELSEGNEEFFGTLSAEVVDEIDADIVFAYVDSAEHLEAVKADPLLGSIPAIKNDAVVMLDDPTFILSTSAPSPLSIPWAIDQYVPLIQDAAANIK